MYLTRQSAQAFYSIPDSDFIRSDDYVEDLATGKREPVRESFYAFLPGVKAAEARKLPTVFDVVRKQQ